MFLNSNTIYYEEETNLKFYQILYRRVQSIYLQMVSDKLAIKSLHEFQSNGSHSLKLEMQF